MKHWIKYFNNVLSVYFPLVKEVSRITNSNLPDKEKLFRIKIAIYGREEDLKEIHNNHIQHTIFFNEKINSAKVKHELQELPTMTFIHYLN